MGEQQSGAVRVHCGARGLRTAVGSSIGGDAGRPAGAQLVGVEGGVADDDGGPIGTADEDPLVAGGVAGQRDAVEGPRR